MYTGHRGALSQPGTSGNAAPQRLLATRCLLASADAARRTGSYLLSTASDGLRALPFRDKNFPHSSLPVDEMEESTSLLQLSLAMHHCLIFIGNPRNNT